MYRHIHSLDGLRGLCALLVLVGHCLQYWNIPWATHVYFRDAAVVLFFALSGFFMAYNYLGQECTTISAYNFVLHRFARIYPAYITAVAMVVGLGFIPEIGELFSKWDMDVTGLVQILRQVFALGSRGVFWSIVPEIQFYAFFLLVWLFINDQSRWYYIGIGIAVYIPIANLFGNPGPGILLTSKLHLFMIGVVVGYLYVKGIRPRNDAVTGVLSLFVLAAYFVCSSVTNFDIWSLASALTCGLILYFSAVENPVSSLLLSSPPLRYLGKISFSLYLFHAPISLIVMEYVPAYFPYLVAEILSFGLPILFAHATYGLIEKPCRFFLVERLKYRQTAVPASA